MPPADELHITAKSFDNGKSASLAIGIVVIGVAVSILIILAARLPAGTVIIPVILFIAGPVVFLKAIRERFPVSLALHFTPGGVQAEQRFLSKNKQVVTHLPLNTISSYAVYFNQSKNTNVLTLRTNDGKRHVFVFYSDDASENKKCIPAIIQWFATCNKRGLCSVKILPGFLATRAGLVFIFVAMAICVALVFFSLNRSSKATPWLVGYTILILVVCLVGRQRALENARHNE